MRNLGGCYKYLFVLPYLWLASCSMMDEQAKKSATLGLIATPVTYYSTAKARYLGEKYKVNLDRLIEQITRNPKTANLQFANNIVSTGGIGFFTHSAVRVPDERYLEVILATPETFETPGEFSSKLDRVFSLYGTELLSVLSTDSAIYQEKEVSGYGLNLSWRKIAADARGPRVTLERAIVYFPKENVRSFFAGQVSRKDLLEKAAVFAVEDDRAPTLVSFRAPEPRQDFRPPIREEHLAAKKLDPKPKLQTPPRASSLPTPPVPSSPVPAGQKAAPEMGARTQSPESMAETKASPPSVAKQPADGSKKPALHASSTPSTPAALPTPSQATMAEPKQEEATGSPRQEPIGASQTPTVQASGKRPEPLPREEAGIEAEPKSPPIVTETRDRSVTGTKPIAPAASQAKPADRAESKDSPRVQAKEPLGDIGSADVKPERPVALPDKAETTEVASAKSAADSASSEEETREPLDSPGDTPSELVKAAPPIPPVPQVAPKEAPPAAEITPPVPPVPQTVPQKTPRTAEITRPVPPVPPVAPQEAPPAAEPISTAPTGQEKASPDTDEQLALLRTPPSEPATEKKPLARPVPKPLEGFVIQVGFSERAQARQWAEAMQRRGYAVSLTEASGGSVRVRVGNFGARDEAERQLRSFREDGLTGIVINLPQAFRPQGVESQSEQP